MNTIEKNDKKETPTKYIFRGEIYMVDLTDQNIDGKSVHCGRRPCIIISNDVGNRYSSCVNVCLLTTKKMEKKYPTHLVLEPNELNKSKLTSVAMTEQIRTLGKEKLMFKIGKLTDEEIHKLNETIMFSLDLGTDKITN